MRYLVCVSFTVFLLTAMEPVSQKHKKLFVPQTTKAQKLFAQAKEFIENRNNLPGAVSCSNTPLLIDAAASDEHLATIWFLLSHGADPNSVNDEGSTPLGQAAFHCASKTVKLLLYWKADPNHKQYQQTSTKETPLHLACRPSLDSSDPKINRARIEIVELLCAAGANTNARDCHCHTPFFSATLVFQKYKLSALLSANTKHIFHTTRKSIIETLMLCKGNPTLLDTRGYCPLTQPDSDPYLTIFTAYKLTERRKKLRAVLLKFLSGAHGKENAISPFKGIPCDILRYILKHAYS